MEIMTILDQMVSAYGHPMPNVLLQNDTLFRSVYSPNNAPEVLLRQIKNCQEIQTLGDDPYAPMQLLINAIRLLLGCGLYQHDFEEWDTKIPTKKVWINLKPFSQEAYQRRLNATNNTTGQHGYVQNACAVLEDNNKEDDENLNGDAGTVTTHLATMTMQI